MTTLEQQLRNSIEGDIHFDDIHRTVYSVDASIYEIAPIGIVVPKTLHDLIQTINIAHSQQIPIIPRGAATGITGGCLGKGLIIDTSKYLNNIIEINYDAEYAICEPGVVQDTLNAALSERGYRLGPDTSTGNRATLGGMLANNAAGARSLFFGTMADHVLEVELLLSSGNLINFKAIDEQEWQHKCLPENEEGHIYRKLLRIRNQYREDIQKHFPKIPRRVSGYNLEALLEEPSFNICKIIAGSEGSLGIATKIKVKICKKPTCLSLSVIHFASLMDAFKAVENILQYSPISLELIDHRILEMGKKAPSMRGKLDWLVGDPQAILVAEFDDFKKLANFTSEMQKKGVGYAQSSLDDPEKMAHVWEIRKSGLGLLLSKRSYSRAIAFLEDISVSPKQLATFMEKFIQYLSSIGKEAGIYGHVGSGCMHIRPYIDLRNADELKLMEKMMLDVSDMLLEHGGALSGEHGDGFIRSWLNKKMFGDTLYQAFLELKTAFDPLGLMNPGKIVNGLPLVHDLRLSPETKQTKIETFLNFEGQGGFELAADLCNGNGLCRKSEKLMCPSFQATRDEFDTTRARAQALRAVINGKVPIENFTSKEMHDVLDLCLECKGCKTECPSEVDMAKMKAEFLFHYQKRHGKTLRSWIFANIGLINTMRSPIGSFFNWFGDSMLGKLSFSKLGIAPQRSLPKLAKERFSTWYAKHEMLKSDKQVVLLNDTFTEFHHPEVGQAAVKILEALGYAVIVPKWECCGRPAFSKGFLPQAKQQAMTLVNMLKTYADQNIAIIGLEPSCLLTIKDDYSSLVDKSHVESIVQASITIDEFLNSHLVNGIFDHLHLEPINHPIKLHGHCHQKALVGTKATLNVLRAIPGANVIEIDSGCCGLAGSFGYEVEHYDISMKIGELKLFPSIRQSSEATLIVADGFSCRSQIEHGTSRRAYHLVEILAKQLTP